MQLFQGLLTLLSALVVAAYYDYHSVFPSYKTSQRRVIVDEKFGADTTTIFNPRSESSPFGWVPPSAFADLQIDLAEMDADTHGELTNDNVVERVRSHSIELVSTPFRVAPPPELLVGGSFSLEMRAMTRAQLTDLDEGGVNEGTVARVEMHASGQQVLPPVIPFDKAYWTDPNDDLRFASAGGGMFIRAIAKENNTFGLPSVGASALMLTNKGVWAVVSVNTVRPSGFQSFVQVSRVAVRYWASQWHVLAVEYDTANNTVHFDVDGQRKLSVENYGVLSDRMRTIQQLSDGPFKELTPLNFRGLLAMGWMPDADDPLPTRSNTGLLRLRDEDYAVPDDSVPEAFSQRISLHRHRVIGHGMKMQLRRFSFFQLD